MRYATSDSEAGSKPRMGHLRSYIAGTGATGALVGGIVVTFLAVGAFVGFSSADLGGGESAESAELRAGTRAPETAGLTLAGAPAAVAASPSGPAAGPGEAAAGTAGAGAPVVAASSGFGAGTGAPDGPLAPLPDPPVDQPGPVTGAVDQVDETAGGLGVDATLGPATEGVTRPVDEAIGDVVDGVPRQP